MAKLNSLYIGCPRKNSSTVCKLITLDKVKIFVPKFQQTTYNRFYTWILNFVKIDTIHANCQCFKNFISFKKIPYVHQCTYKSAFLQRHAFNTSNMIAIIMVVNVTVRQWNSHTFSLAHWQNIQQSHHLDWRTWIEHQKLVHGEKIDGRVCIGKPWHHMRKVTLESS